MNQDEIKRAANSLWPELAAEAKVYFLSLLSHNLTVSIRLIHSEQMSADETVKKMYGLNEVQHRLSSALMNLTQKSGVVHPNEQLINLLYSFAQEYNCEWELTLALGYPLNALPQQ